MIQEKENSFILLPFLNKKPFDFQQAFCSLFRGAECKEDVFLLTEKIFDLMWYRLRNGRVVFNKDIYFLWGLPKKSFLSLKKDKHHFPPQSRDSEARTIKIAEDFHKDLHTVFMNLYKEKELLLFLQALFVCDGINTKKGLWEVADRIREGVKKEEDL